MPRFLRRADEGPGPSVEDGDPVADLFTELDQARATVYRQSIALREEEARVVRERAAAQADEHRRILAAVRAMSRRAVEAESSPDVRSFAVRVEAAVARLEPEPPLALT